MTDKSLGLKPKEAAALIGVSTTSVYRAMKRGEIPYVVLSGCKVIPRAALERMFEAS